MTLEEALQELENLKTLNSEMQVQLDNSRIIKVLFLYF